MKDPDALSYFCPVILNVQLPFCGQDGGFCFCCLVTHMFWRAGRGKSRRRAWFHPLSCVLLVNTHLSHWPEFTWSHFVIAMKCGLYSELACTQLTFEDSFAEQKEQIRWWRTMCSLCHIRMSTILLIGGGSADYWCCNECSLFSCMIIGQL